MRYKVGDKVRVKDLEEIERGNSGDLLFIDWMKPYCGRVLTIREISFEIYQQGSYLMYECSYYWSDYMLEDVIDPSLGTEEEVRVATEVVARLVNI